ncbi:soluble scavenger receptor cysteine-rich domain-containing protein SSC5D-like [Epinephelus moara]|uniref:soluble scavenger receptor cysteine-rich domain-containing protein SSC5D-like n=1 Tax=Epinephelus moara TaxID=300413 RepID=UPI00214F521A|nr:soluble scavenger receptor cysteine-rich domain-containing protein SSC5D-like [Epinephelus moara]
MDHVLMLLLLLWSSGLQAKENHNSTESVRLVGGKSHCAGMLEVKHKGEWRPVSDTQVHFYWTLKEADIMCSEMDCGSAVSVRSREESSTDIVWGIGSACVHSGFALSDCATSLLSSSFLDLNCSDSVRLVNGSHLCSGRVEVKSNQRWSSVCEADFDQQDAEVVCRELGCGSPLFFQGALYGEVEAPVWTKEFQCGGHESVLLDCGSSGPARNTCSPGNAVGLTCLDPVRLDGGDSHCEGDLKVKHDGVWRRVDDLTLREADFACKDLNCGSAVSVGRGKAYSERSVWVIDPDCVQSGSPLRECAISNSTYHFVHLTCSDSVRLVNGPSLCSGRLEVKSNQQWSSVCEADFDQQDAEVVCRELGCGSPLFFQGALYGEEEDPMWTKEFQCGGHESVLLDCGSSGPARNTCSPGNAVGLTCLDPVRLVGGDSRCAGYLKVKQGDWKQVSDLGWTLKEADFACRALYCGSAVSVGHRERLHITSGTRIHADCVSFGSPRRDCTTINYSLLNLNLTCSDLLLQPNISVSSNMDGISQAQQQGFQVFRGSDFTISCSIQPEYPGGSFLLTFTSSNSTRNYTQPAVNHSSHFLFPSAESAHQGNYSCVYVLSHDILFESQLLSLTISVSDPTPFIIRAVVLLLTMVLVNAAICIYCKASRRQRAATQENIELDYCNQGGSAAEGGLI